MSDPIEDAFKSLHQGNLLAAKDARIKQLEQQVESYRAAVMVGVTENTRLKAEVERLQKLVGMQESIDKSIDAWIESKTAAKEGKQSNG
jgi:regulator of replication initiation timing